MNDNTTEEKPVRPNFISLDGFKARKEQEQRDKESAHNNQLTEVELERIYEIHVKNRDVFEARGSLMVTPVFIAIGDREGNFKVVVPLENLDYVTCTEDFIEQAIRSE